MRTFVAIELPPLLTGMLGGIQAALKERIKEEISWVKPSSVHLTLKFLGEVEEKRTEEISLVLEGIAEETPAFSLTSGGVGGFPNMRTPRVLWVGIKDEPALTELQGKTEERLERLGFEKEGKGFHPHLTLCRIKSMGAGKAAGRAAQEIGYDKNIDFMADSFVLFKSVLKPGGAEYSAIKRFSFRGKK